MADIVRLGTDGVGACIALLTGDILLAGLMIGLTAYLPAKTWDMAVEAFVG